MPPPDNSRLYIGLGVAGGAFCLLASVEVLVRFLNTRREKWMNMEATQAI